MAGRLSDDWIHPKIQLSKAASTIIQSHPFCAAEGFHHNTALVRITNSKQSVKILPKEKTVVCSSFPPNAATSIFYGCHAFAHFQTQRFPDAGHNLVCSFVGAFNFIAHEAEVAVFGRVVGPALSCRLDGQGGTCQTRENTQE